MEENENSMQSIQTLETSPSSLLLWQMDENALIAETLGICFRPNFPTQTHITTDMLHVHKTLPSPQISPTTVDKINFRLTQSLPKYVKEMPEASKPSCSEGVSE